MKQQTFEETLQPYIQKILEGLEKGVDYASKEIPEILMQYVAYESITSWLLVVLGFVLLPMINKICKKAYNFDPEFDTPVVVFAYSCYLITPILIFLNIGTAIKATFFPKLFLLEKFINLI